MVYALSRGGCEESGSIGGNSLVAAQRSFCRRAGADRHGDAAHWGQPCATGRADTGGKVKREGALASWPSSITRCSTSTMTTARRAPLSPCASSPTPIRKSPLLEGAAQWLVVNRSGGYWWNSTEQTAMVLFGLVDYLAASQELNADFDVDVLLNGGSIGKRHFTAADAASGVDFPVEVAAGQLHPGSNEVQISKHGSGRAYWSVQGKYYSTEQKLYQQGTLSLNITRDYFKLSPITKDGQIVYRLDPIKGPVNVGGHLGRALAVNGSPAKYLLIEDPIPAGTEFVQQGDSYNILDQPQRGSTGTRGASSTMTTPPSLPPSPAAGTNLSIYSRW